MSKHIDLAIIGAGIGGVSSAVYAARSGLNCMLFEGNAIGGQLLFMENIDNYIGLKMGTKGRDLAKTLEETVKGLKINIVNESISKIDISDRLVQLSLDDSLYVAKGVIAATGASFKKLGVEGEAQFLGRGVSYCAVCDGFFFKGKDVCVVGGGNTAVEEALYLSDIARKVYLVHRRDELRAMGYLQKELFEKKNIEVIFDSIIHKIDGGEFLNRLSIENTKTGRLSSLEVNGLFVAVGVRPNTDIFKDIISMDDNGFILTDEHMKSSYDCIWACGDCRKRPLKQLITAAAEGAVAALSAYKYLKGYYISS
ncbi:MAG: thioredoxin-disulfide reductase [Candidatus Omnitrophota bacterium]|nr:thioredoxin-disulfide reductase [Candidatus Omnitrophota bacterium]